MAVATSGMFPQQALDANRYSSQVNSWPALLAGRQWRYLPQPAACVLPLGQHRFLRDTGAADGGLDVPQRAQLPCPDRR
jgi:hypothetical protein